MTTTTSTTTANSSSYTGIDLLYQDQQNAMEARAEYEKSLIQNAKELTAPVFKSMKKKQQTTTGSNSRSSGMGFGGSSSTSNKNKKDFLGARVAKEQAKIIERDGVLRINNALSPALADSLRQYILEEQALADAKTKSDSSLSKSFYGVENQRKHRCDLQLSLLRGGFGVDSGDVSDKSPTEHFVADTLQELLGARGSLRSLYENLVTLDGEFYELAALVTNPGSSRQMFHPDVS